MHWSALLLAVSLVAACADEQEPAAGDMQTPCLSAEAASGTQPIPAGTYTVGADGFYPDEGPARVVELDAFDIDATEVTNAQFAEFVDVTGYITRAERGLPEEIHNDWPDDLRAPGSAVFIPPSGTDVARASSWWRFVSGANWRAPAGPGSTLEGKEHYPVVHIAHEDAVAYAAWKGRRLPTEAEWEAAAGIVKTQPAANTWQGIFPVLNQESDGYRGLAPVGCYAPNGFDLYDMIGNVWEWTSDAYYPDRVAINDPAAPPSGRDRRQPGVAVGVIKGGSYLCAPNYCARYRPEARHAQDLLLGASHIGFRTVGDVQ